LLAALYGALPPAALTTDSVFITSRLAGVFSLPSAIAKDLEHQK